LFDVGTVVRDKLTALGWRAADVWGRVAQVAGEVDQAVGRMDQV